MLLGMSVKIEYFCYFGLSFHTFFSEHLYCSWYIHEYLSSKYCTFHKWVTPAYFAYYTPKIAWTQTSIGISRAVVLIIYVYICIHYTVHAAHLPASFILKFNLHIAINMRALAHLKIPFFYCPPDHNFTLLQKIL